MIVTQNPVAIAKILTGTNLLEEPIHLYLQKQEATMWTDGSRVPTY